MDRPPAFRLQTLGALRLTAADGTEEPSLATRRRKLALLALLAVSGKPISRDRLVGLFWGDHAEDRARHSLSDALSHLRRVLGPSAISARKSDVALADDYPLQVDLRDLADAARDEDWPRVLSLFGGPFLDGVHIEGSVDWEHWVLAQRTGSVRLFETACHAELRRLQAAADWVGLDALAWRWLEVQPDNPTARALQRSATVALESARQNVTTQESSPVAAGAVGGAAAVGPHGAAAEPLHSADTRLGNDTERREVTHVTAAARNERPRWRRRVGGLLAAIAVVTAGTLLADGDRATSLSLTTRSPEARALVARASLGSDGGVSRTEAIALLEQAIALDSTFAMALRTLALLHAGDGTHQAEVASLLTRAAAAAEAVSPHERALVMSSYHLLVTGDLARAAAEQRHLIRLAPDDGDAWHDLGMTYQYLGDDARAAEAYRSALARDPSSGATWANLLDALVATGDRAATDAALDSMTRAIPGHPWIFLATARVRAAQGDLPRAERAIRAYLAATPDTPRRQGIGELTLARILWTAGRLEEGDAAIQRGIVWQERLGDTVMALRESLAGAAVRVWLHEDRRAAAAQLDASLRRFPLTAMAPEDRPLAELATVQALVGRAADAEATLRRLETSVVEPIRRRNAGAISLAHTTLALARQDLSAARTWQRRYLASPATLRGDLLDGLHQRWVAPRLSTATPAASVSAVGVPSAPRAASPSIVDPAARH